MHSDADDMVVYGPRRMDFKDTIVTLLFFAMGAILLYQGYNGHDQDGGSLRQFGDVKSTVVGGLMLCIGVFGMSVHILNRVIGLPRLLISSKGIKYETLRGASWAWWDSLGSFELAENTPLRRNASIHAPVIGKNVMLHKRQTSNLNSAFIIHAGTLDRDAVTLIETLDCYREEFISSQKSPLTVS